MKKKTKRIPVLRVQPLFRFSTGQRQTSTTLDPTLTTITITTTGLPQENDRNKAGSVQR
ncbi:hypothetical protein [Pontibacter indicus]|uniref:Uncharacterized protein n=1 Tax=Pontibacter indicus TaxID=1317125 RepID=A0A1R3XTP6_9BACT|nr:hypothetical protein [Pontibacter indicus]SIT95251.1 hypothetical protein SAMN05444128_3986 [Pontibacter indicus]